MQRFSSSTRFFCDLIERDDGYVTRLVYTACVGIKDNMCRLSELELSFRANDVQSNLYISIGTVERDNPCYKQVMLVDRKILFNSI